ncbi:response regulator [Oscillatoria laete-virens NRMC-F 0139]|nr:response regulator [Oscillatoria laete-virens]MDL5053329.1 response regulator [Oscillatoria laete-virens NRMC-F 0139]
MSKICALVVDDNADIAEAVCDRLESLGHKCVCVSSQDDARQAIAKQRFSYVLLDLEIPVKVGRGVPRIQNGENLLQEVKQSELQKGVPIIVMSGHGIDSPSLAVQMMKKGACDYVVKPFPETGNTLEKAISDALAGSSGAPVAAPVVEEKEPAKAKAAISPAAGDEMILNGIQFRCGVHALPTN